MEGIIFVIGQGGSDVSFNVPIPLEPILTGGVGVIATLLLILILLLRGHIRHEREVEREKERGDILERTNRELAEGLKASVETGETTNKLLSELRSQIETQSNKG